MGEVVDVAVVGAGQPGLAVGYRDWTGPGSATLIGVGRSARDTVAAVRTRLAAL